MTQRNRKLDWNFPYKQLSRVVKVLTLTGFVFALAEPYAVAQIIPDSTLGEQSSIVTPHDEVDGTNTDFIEGGAALGSNLFHSFLEFNVTQGQRVYFTNPLGIENILSRVTGNQPSNILGTLGVDGAANLFLLNPQGIIFGPEAQLDIRGSFLASTANSLLFENGSQFSATNPEAPPLLTINLTPGLQYRADNRGTLTNQGNLVVGQDLRLSGSTISISGLLAAPNGELNVAALVGDAQINQVIAENATLSATGNLLLEESQLQTTGNLTLLAQNTVSLRDSSTNPSVTVVGGRLLVQGETGVDIFVLNHPQSRLIAGGDLVLRSANPVVGDAQYISGGNFRIEKLDSTWGQLASAEDPIIRAVGDVSFDTYEGASLHILSGGQVKIGSVKITGANAGAGGVEFITEDVTLSDGETLLAIDGSKQATLDVRSGMIPAEILEPLGLSGLFPVLEPSNPVSPTRTSADISIGNISMNAPDGLVLLTNQYQADSSLPGGSIEVGKIQTDGDVGGFVGNSGSVVIDSRGDLRVSDRIDASSNSGNAGNITLIAQELISLDRSFLITNTSGTGQGGDIYIQTGSFSATNGAQIRADTEGQGANAGRVTIVARDTVSFDGVGGMDPDRGQATEELRTGILNRIRRGAQGDSGGISIKTGSLYVSNGAQFQVRVQGKGNSGGIAIIANDLVSFDGVSSEEFGRVNTTAGISSIEGSGEGSAGDIYIEAKSVTLTNGADLQSNTIGKGDAGNVTIIASEQVVLDGEGRGRGSKILSRVNSSGRGEGGDIYIQTGSLAITNGATLKASTEGEGNAGNVSIVADSVLVEGKQQDGERSGVFSLVDSEARGEGGQIHIEADSLSVFNGASLDSSTIGAGNAGNLIINSQRTTIKEGASISASTFGEFDAGDITLNATESVVVSDDGAIFSGVGERATGNGGKIEINTSSLALLEGGSVETRTFGFIPAAIASEYSSYGEVVQADGPVAYWRLDETIDTSATDASGNNFNGTYTGGVAQGLPGVSGTAADFDGTGGAVEIGQVAPGSGLDIQNQSFTVEAWLKPEENPPEEQVYLGMHSDDVQRQSLNLKLKDEGSIRFGYFNNTLNGPEDTVNFGEGWYHVVTTYDQPSDTSRIFVNGQQVDRGSDGPFEGGPPSVRIGSWRDAADLPFKGLIDEVAVYRTALPTETVVAHYYTGQSQLGLPISDTGANAGNINVNAESIEISGISPTQGTSSGLFSGTEGDFSGQGGGINLTTNSLKIANGGVLSARTLNQSQGGSISVNARTVELTGGGQILTSALGRGSAGEITLDAKQVTLAGVDPRFAERTAQFDKEKVDTESPASGLFARAASGNGGNISLQGQDLLLLRYGAQISTTAGTAGAGGDGGNIDIDADLIVAFAEEDSDITANAFEGRGGNINITTEGIFGIEFRQQETEFSDITASSRFGLDGEVEINRPDTDPSRGLSELPTELVDAARLVDRSCTPGGRTTKRSSFVVTGRGGLPANPVDSLSSDAMITNWVTLDSEPGNQESVTNDQPVARATAQPIVAAQGWTMLAEGKVLLTAELSQVTPEALRIKSTACQDSEN
ncbi:two-partner secretion domain-containing protein [Lyngbya aestuarii]|uniref:two-partner secretion domain-containing protein n=1 Tax=Lyngbya aestuarii TaxID=118322 RepID=UPI00403DE92B